MSGDGATSNFNLASKYDVKTSGIYSFFIIVCVNESQDRFELPSSIDLVGSLDFHNSHGWLPASYYGFLPFHMVLAIIYVVILLIYSVSLYRIRHILITKFNVAMIVVITISLIENASWFAMYQHSNSGGSYFCCPVLPLIWVSAIINVVKRTVVRVLIMVLSVGFGVTKSELEPKEKRLVLFVGVGYLIASLNADLQIWAAIDNNYGQSSFIWQLPVTILDTIVLSSVYFSLTEMMGKLTNEGQTEKLKMYKTLSKVLSVFLLLLFLFTFITVLVGRGVIPFDWTLLWLFIGPSSAFWHVIFLAFIISIVVIWPPSEKSAFMAFNTQVPANEDDADNLEMGGSAAAVVASSDDGDFFDDVETVDDSRRV